MEEALVALLLADATLAGLVGTRIQWNERPQGSALPAVTLQRISGADSPGYAGPDGLADSTVQVECWGRTYAAAKAVARAVKAVAPGRHSTTLKGVFLLSERDDFQHEAPDSIHRISLDLRVWHQA